MHDLAILYRAAQFYTHNAHNLVYGDEFFQDHEFLGGLYATYETAYDDVVERMIGLNLEVNLPDFTCKASSMVESLAPFEDNDSAFKQVLDFEIQFCSELYRENSSSEYSIGTKNFLQGLCDESEKRQYKIQQRTKSDDATI